MKTNSFLDDLNLDGSSPLAGLRPAPALSTAATADWDTLKAILQGRIGGAVDPSRVAAVQRAIDAGRYVASAVAVAERLLATIAPGRRH